MYMKSVSILHKYKFCISFQLHQKRLEESKDKSANGLTKKNVVFATWLIVAHRGRQVSEQTPSLSV